MLLVYNLLTPCLPTPTAQLAACLQAVEHGNTTELRLHAHALKGTCAALCLPQLRQVSAAPSPHRRQAPAACASHPARVLACV